MNRGELSALEAMLDIIEEMDELAREIDAIRNDNTHSKGDIHVRGNGKTGTVSHHSG